MILSEGVVDILKWILLATAVIVGMNIYSKILERRDKRQEEKLNESREK